MNIYMKDLSGRLIRVTQPLSAAEVHASSRRNELFDERGVGVRLVRPSTGGVGRKHPKNMTAAELAERRAANKRANDARDAKARAYEENKRRIEHNAKYGTNLRVDPNAPTKADLVTDRRKQMIADNIARNNAAGIKNKEVDSSTGVRVADLQLPPPSVSPTIPESVARRKWILEEEPSAILPPPPSLAVAPDAVAVSPASPKADGTPSTPYVMSEDGQTAVITTTHEGMPINPSSTTTGAPETGAASPSVPVDPPVIEVASTGPPTVQTKALFSATLADAKRLIKTATEELGEL